MDAAALKSNGRLNVPVPTSRSFSYLTDCYDIRWPANSDARENTRVWLDMELVTALLRALANGITVDDAWYCERYPDVEDGIRKGEFKSAKHHYVQFGYFEDRLPQYFEVDDEFYGSAYPDIAGQLDAGGLPSSQEHFELYGFREGRLPWSEWRLIG
jgi:hypothetical protein